MLGELVINQGKEKAVQHIERKEADVKRRIVLIVRIRDAQDLPTFSFIRRILLLQMKY